jgi:hypothetical protein
VDLVPSLLTLLSSRREIMADREENVLDGFPFPEGEQKGIEIAEESI